MKPITCICLIFILQLVSTKLNAQPAPHPGDVTDVRIVRSVKQEPRAALLAIPHLAEWKPKHFVVAYEVGVAGKTDMGSVDAVVTTNDGDTWSIPTTIFDHTERHGQIQFGYANPVLFKVPGQAIIWCFAMRCPMNYGHSEDSHLAAAYSGDGGRSWSPVELAMQYTGPLIIVGDIQRVMEDGHPVYLLPAHRNTRRNDPLGTREQFVLRSTSLLDWSLGGYIPQPEKGRIFLHEGQIAVENDQGHLKMVMRTARDDKEGIALDPPRAWSSTSLDHGRTWTQATEEPELWNSVAEAWFGQSRTGQQLYVYNDGPAWSRAALRYKVKPGGGTWSEERTFFDAGIKTSYPTLLEVSPGEFRAVWDSGTDQSHRREIRFGKLTF